MQVPYQLRRRPTAAPADAWLLPSPSPEGLLACCARIGLDPLPPVYALAGGYLLPLPAAAPRPTALPGALRLRRLADNLFLPADADLSPRLHAEEARALTRKRGLVFLPGGRVLEFAPDRPLPLAALLTAPVERGGGWRPLPTGPGLAERLDRVVLKAPELTPDELLDAGAGDLASEAPRPPAVGPAQQIAGRAALNAARALGWLGRLLRLEGLRGAAARMADRAVRAAPRLTEELLGRQEAALRELLRQFRAGDAEEALRRALPLGGGESRGGDLHPNARLPTHNLLYSLAGLLGGRGPASVWYGGADDLQRELAREYRQAAERAARRGDYRRAAFIYGRLLGDYRAAADALAAGGLHHDAAVLFRDKLDDPSRAARAFEAAGEWDAALELYRLRREHEAAGDLLRRLGEEAAALEEYHSAARLLIQQRRDYLAAGDLLWTKTERSDLAGIYFTLGWQARTNRTDSANAVPCAVRLARLHADAAETGPLFQLIGEAEAYVRPPAAQSAAGQFFTAVARLAELPQLAPVREELRDRALTGLALKLRQHARREQRPGTVVSDLLGAAGVWPAAVQSDAAFALSRGLRTAGPRAERSLDTVRVGEGTVTAACLAPESGEVLVGFSDGQVVCFQPRTGRVAPVGMEMSSPVVALATDANARMVVVMRQDDKQTHLTSHWWRASAHPYQVQSQRVFDRAEVEAISPLIDGEGFLVALADAEFVWLLGGPTMLALGGTELESVSGGAILLLPRPGRLPRLLRLAGREVRVISLRLRPADPLEPRPADELYTFHTSEPALPLGWVPGVPEGSPLLAPPLSWLQSEDDRVELAGLTRTGTLCYSDLSLAADAGPQGRSWKYDGCRAVALLRPGLLAAVSSGNQVHWLRTTTRDRPDEWAPAVPLPPANPAVACFASAATRELIVLLADGLAVRVPVPTP